MDSDYSHILGNLGNAKKVDDLEHQDRLGLTDETYQWFARVKNEVFDKAGSYDGVFPAVHSTIEKEFPDISVEGRNIMASMWFTMAGWTRFNPAPWRKWRGRPKHGEGNMEDRYTELKNLYQLTDDQDRYDSPPDARSLLTADTLLILSEYYEIVPERVAPSTEGGVAIYYTFGDNPVYVEIFNKGDSILGVGYDSVEDITDFSPCEIIERVIWWKEKNK